MTSSLLRRSVLLLVILTVAGCGSQPRSMVSQGSTTAPPRELKSSQSPSIQSERQTVQHLYARGEAPVSVTQKDVIQWTAGGVSDAVIIERIIRCEASFKLTAADENLLRDRGVSASVIESMKATSRR